VAKLADRENSQGTVSAVVDGNVGAIVALKSETDFAAKSADFVELVQELVDLVAAKGPEAIAERQEEIENLKLAKKEKHRGG